GRHRHARGSAAEQGGGHPCGRWQPPAHLHHRLRESQGLDGSTALTHRSMVLRERSVTLRDAAPQTATDDASGHQTGPQIHHPNPSSLLVQGRNTQRAAKAVLCTEDSPPACREL
ncbi:MAG: hypothetical protein ACK56I_32620, partial [bacterium]